MTHTPIATRSRSRVLLAALATGILFATSPAGAEPPTPTPPDDTYSYEEVLEAGKEFFGAVSEGLATVIKQVFEQYGRPNAIIKGSDAAGAFVVGVRYGSGQLVRKTLHQPLNVYWTGPSAGFDFGGSGSQAFMLVYNLGTTDQLFQRFPGVEGSVFFVAGVGVNYYQSEDTILAPIRTGVGLRSGVSAGYLHFTRRREWVPF